MTEDWKLTRLIAGIYDAALDSARWPDVLAGIAGFVDGRMGGLLARHRSSQSLDARWQAGGDPHYVRLYAETYSRLGPIATSPPGGIETIVSIPDLVPYDEFRRGRFYGEWAAPQGLVDVAVALLDRSSSGSAYLSMVRDESTGMVDDTMRRRMALVVPHVRRAVLIGKTVDFKRSEAATFADVLDGLSASVFLVDAAGRIVHANVAGENALRGGDILRTAGSRLVLSDPQVDSALREAVAAAAVGDAEIGNKGMAVPVSARDGERYVVHVLPLSSGERQGGRPAAATAALFVRKAALEFPSPREVIGKTYNLTPAELRVLLAIVEIGGVPEVAAAFGIAETTVKTHLARLFEKTGTGRQADLVKLVAGFSTPFVC